MYSHKEKNGNGSDTGSNNPTASEAERMTPRRPQPAPNSGVLQHGAIGGEADRPGDDPRSVIRNS